MQQQGPIGVFDSGYGGLTVLQSIVEKLPAYDYLYLGDNARAPYGTRSFNTVYHYTLECVQWFFNQGCHLVILACNTASAKALRSIQQNDLERIGAGRKVLGVIRPTTEKIGAYTNTGRVGILGTNGTIQSQSYKIEIGKFSPGIQVYQQACPMWVPLVEQNEHLSDGADFFIKKDLQSLFAQAEDIDTVVLACTHYPLLKDKIAAHLPTDVQLLSQGDIVADSLVDYLNRHDEIAAKCSRGSSLQFYTTDSAEDFDSKASVFFGKAVNSRHVDIAPVKGEGAKPIS